jgi:hypothetical protein
VWTCILLMDRVTCYFVVRYNPEEEQVTAQAVHTECAYC